MDKFKFPTLFSILGNVFFMTVFLFVGPVTFMPVAPQKHLMQAMMALAGAAYAAVVVSSFSRAQKRVLDMGFVDDINTHVMISGKADMRLLTADFRFLRQCSPRA